jgi:hypothetical protein
VDAALLIDRVVQGIGVGHKRPGSPPDLGPSWDGPGSLSLPNRCTIVCPCTDRSTIEKSADDAVGLEATVANERLELRLVSHVAPADEDTTAAVERIGALLESDRLRWLTRSEALASGRTDCEQCGGSLDGLG